MALPFTELALPVAPHAPLGRVRRAAVLRQAVEDIRGTQAEQSAALAAVLALEGRLQDALRAPPAQQAPNNGDGNGGAPLAESGGGDSKEAAYARMQSMLAARNPDAKPLEAAPRMQSDPGARAFPRAVSRMPTALTRPGPVLRILAPPRGCSRTGIPETATAIFRMPSTASSSRRHHRRAMPVDCSPVSGCSRDSPIVSGSALRRHRLRVVVCFLPLCMRHCRPSMHGAALTAALTRHRLRIAACFLPVCMRQCRSSMQGAALTAALTRHRLRVAACFLSMRMRHC